MDNETLLDPLLGSWFGMSNTLMVFISAFLAIGAVVLITITVSWALETKIFGKKNYRLVDIIFDANGFPSLSKFQFLLWTLIILFSFLTVGFIRIFGGFLGSGWEVKIPENLIYLLGISIAIVPTSAYITKNKYGETNPSSNDKITVEYLLEDIQWLEKEIVAVRRSMGHRYGRSTKPRPKKPKPERDRKSFWTILLEGGIPSLTKFQMFSWTWIAVGIYGLTFLRLLSGFASGEIPVNELLLPDVSSTLVALMGVSQAAYVGGKWVAPKKPTINTISPDSQINGGDITIKGVNFGATQGNSSVKIDNKDATIKNWEDTEIECTIKGQTTTGKKELVVIVGGSKDTTIINII